LELSQSRAGKVLEMLRRATNRDSRVETRLKDISSQRNFSFGRQRWSAKRLRERQKMERGSFIKSKCGQPCGKKRKEGRWITR